MHRGVVLSLIAGLSAGGVAAFDGPDVILPGPLRYEIVAQGARLNREVTGKVVFDIRGVPAEPVDSMVYDGVGSTPVEGHFLALVDPSAEVGIIEASWTDEHGRWTYEQDVFFHPEHLSGVRLGSSVSILELLAKEGVSHNVYLHGDGGAGQPVLPLVFNLVAMWGPADVTLDGTPFENPFANEWPAPRWAGHIMVSEGVRQPDGTVRNTSDEIYSPATDAGLGLSDPSDLEVHLTFHDHHHPPTGNFPPLFSFFYHLVFEDVAIQIVENDEPIVTDPRPRPELPRGGR